ncbi:MAG: hypothetical protein V4678_03875 [Patescibacteria group bacterium]
MNTLKQLLAVAAVIVSPLAMALPASATESNCTITNTGPDSNNTCTVTTKYTCEVDNENKVIVRDENNQVAGSGSATSSGNTSGGGATSGSASNSNGAVFDVKIENGGCEVTKASVPVTPTQPVGGSGAAGPAPAGGAGAVVAAAPRPTVLPNTSGENFALVGLVIAGVLAAVAAGARGLNLLQNRR